jgi:hypothetical protein
MGIEPPANSLKNNTLSVEGGAESGALDRQARSIDPALLALIDAWPTLPLPIRAAILALVESGR